MEAAGLLVDEGVGFVVVLEFDLVVQSTVLEEESNGTQGMGLGFEFFLQAGNSELMVGLWVGSLELMMFLLAGPQKRLAVNSFVLAGIL